MKKSNILQIDNHYIQEELRKTQLNKQEKNKKNRFMGMILILVVFLFVLPTYNLVENYQKLQEQENQLAKLKVRYEELSKQEEKESTLVKKLEDQDYAAKYIRAKYQYSKEDEFIYNIPGLLPK
ncbi:TPA: septum formation initiator family protein [Streptococcus suis]|nr:septum formation initiator family protein [Streptococcus suis]HEL1584176.1 septum formation initiator family protein [Streptococcus suis]HEL1639864.1 septum formation initiator family protein [Streptococcus suis]